jgi:hypothetical protein
VWYQVLGTQRGYVYVVPPSFPTAKELLEEPPRLALVHHTPGVAPLV